VIGDIVTDVLAVYSGQISAGSDTAASIAITAGGSAANTAAWLSYLGVPVTLGGVVGADDAGTARIAELAGAGVRPSVRRARQAPTGTIVVLSTDGERSMLCDRGANELLSTEDVDAAFSDDVGHLHLSGYTLLDRRSRRAGRHALAVAAARGVSRSVDAASAAPLRRVEEFLTWVRGVDLLFANVDEAGVLAGTPGSAADLAKHLATVTAHGIVKCGSDGAVWASASGEVVAVPADPATMRDPTGAGDAFAAGLLASWLAAGTPEEALRAGAALGARAVSGVGGRPHPSG
jgi:sugar/nucleoside kinase (ribokinase family)